MSVDNARRLGGARLEDLSLVYRRLAEAKRRVANEARLLKAMRQKAKKDASEAKRRRLQAKKQAALAKKKAKKEVQMLKKQVQRQAKAKKIKKIKMPKLGTGTRLVVKKTGLSEEERLKRAAEKAAKLEKKAEEEAKLMKYDLKPADIPAAAKLFPSPSADYRLWKGDAASLLSHQKDAICSTITSRQRGHIYFFGLGSGKTRSAISAAEQYGGAIVIAPATLIRPWEDELKKWEARGSYQLMSYQQFYRHPVDLAGQFVVVDEAHTLRASGSKMSRVIFNELKKAYKVVLLTGTPLYNKPTDISVLLNPVRSGQGRRLPTTDEAYDQEFGKNPQSFAKLVRDNVIYYKPMSDPINYPTVVETTIPLTATAGQAEVYRALEEKNLAELAKLDSLIGQKLDSLTGAEQADVGKLMKKLQAFGQQARQIANRDPRGPAFVPKVQFIVDYVKRHPHQRILVFSHYLESGLEQVASAFSANGVRYGVYTGEESQKKRKQVADNYVEGKLNVLLLSSAGAEGLNLMRTDAVFILEPHWNWSKIRQMIGRAARFQSHPPNSTVYVYKFITTFPAAKMLGIERAMVKIADDKQRRIDEQVKHIIDESNRVVAARRYKCGLAPPPPHLKGFRTQFSKLMQPNIKPLIRKHIRPILPSVRKSIKAASIRRPSIRSALPSAHGR